MKLKAHQIILVCLVLLATSYLLLAIFRWWFADTAFAKGKNLSDAGYVSPALPWLETAVKLMPNEALFHDALADAAAKIAVALYQNQATPSAQQASQLALQESDIALKLNRVHVNFYKTRIRVLLYLADIDPQSSLAALDAFQTALSLSPTDAKLYYNLALLQIQLGQSQAAKLTLQKTLGLKPNYAAARQALDQL